MITTRAHLRETHECLSHSSPSKLLRAQQICERAVCLSMFCRAAITNAARRQPMPRLHPRTCSGFTKTGAAVCRQRTSHVQLMFFAIETMQRSHFNWIAHHSPASQKKTSLGTVSKHIMSHGGVATQTHILRKGFSTEHAQDLSLQRVPCQNAPSPVESSPAAPSCAVWAFHGRMKCHVISHEVQTCFFHLVLRIASNCRHSHSSLQPDPQTAGSYVAHNSFHSSSASLTQTSTVMKLAPAPPCHRYLEEAGAHEPKTTISVRPFASACMICGYCDPFLCQVKRVAPRAEGQEVRDRGARAGVHALRCPRLPRDALHKAVFQHDVSVILQNLLVLSEVLGVPTDYPLVSSRVEPRGALRLQW